MKNFFLKLRRIGAYACLLVVVGVFLFNQIMVLRGAVVSTEEFFAMAKMSLWYNCGAVVVMVFACWLFPKGKILGKADFVALSGIGGFASMVLIGFLVVTSGICAGHFLAALGLVIITAYCTVGLFFLWIYLSDKLCSK